MVNKKKQNSLRKSKKSTKSKNVLRNRSQMNSSRYRPKSSKRKIVSDMKSISKGAGRYNLLIAKNQHLVKNEKLKESVKQFVYMLKRPLPKGSKELNEFADVIKKLYEIILRVVRDSINVTGELAKIAPPVAVALIVMSVWVTIPGAAVAWQNMLTMYGQFIWMGGGGYFGASIKVMGALSGIVGTVLSSFIAASVSGKLAIIKGAFGALKDASPLDIRGLIGFFRG